MMFTYFIKGNLEYATKVFEIYDPNSPIIIYERLFKAMKEASYGEGEPLL